MKASYANVGVGQLCRLFGKTRHAYYDKNWFLEKSEYEAIVALEMVAELRREIPKIGTHKLHFLLKKPLEAHGIKMGRDSLHKLLQDHAMIVKRKRRYAVTTDSTHWLKKYPNRIKDRIVTESEQVWVSDITYILLEDGFNFLSLITDAYSKQIMGHCLHPTLTAEGSLIALKAALSKRIKTTTLTHHSDRGVQYCCSDYVAILTNASIEISMTEKGDPYENAIAERVNGVLKQDFDFAREFKDRKEALKVIDNGIRSYNEIRPHMSCDYLTPVEAHLKTGVLNKRWKHKIYKKKINSDVA